MCKTFLKPVNGRDDDDETVLECQNRLVQKVKKWLSRLLLRNVATHERRTFVAIMTCHDGTGILNQNHVFLTCVIICVYAYCPSALWRKKSNALINGW